MDLDNLGGNGVGAGALPPVAAGGVGGFLFGAAGENSDMKIAVFFVSKEFIEFLRWFLSALAFVSQEFY